MDDYGGWSRDFGTSQGSITVADSKAGESKWRKPKTEDRTSSEQRALLRHVWRAVMRLARARAERRAQSVERRAQNFYFYGVCVYMSQTELEGRGTRRGRGVYKHTQNTKSQGRIWVKYIEARRRAESGEEPEGGAP